MSSRLTIVWAVGATIVAVGALGYIAGKHANAPTTHKAAYDVSRATAQTGEEPRESVPVYAVPEAFATLTEQWRSPVDKSPRGYAALFDTERRELIVEQCAHPGFELDATGQPMDITRGPCVPILWSTIASLTETTAAARNRDGSMVEIALATGETESGPTLTIGFPGHTMTLIPGSKNDLVLAMEKTPRIAQQKRAYNDAMLAARSEARSEGSDH